MTNTKKGRGRPPVPKSFALRRTLRIRVTHELKAKVVALSKLRGVSVSTFVREMLEQCDKTAMG
jgi:antitoxin component of RelBE/YafQ-DinJ toxin-antitoxin module